MNNNDNIFNNEKTIEDLPGKKTTNATNPYRFSFCQPTPSCWVVRLQAESCEALRNIASWQLDLGSEIWGRWDALGWWQYSDLDSFFLLMCEFFSAYFLALSLRRRCQTVQTHCSKQTPYRSAKVQQESEQTETADGEVTVETRDHRSHRGRWIFLLGEYYEVLKLDQ